MRGIGTAAKAVYAALVAGLGSLGAILVGDATIGAVSAGQWVAIVLVALGAGGGVYKIRNTVA